MNIIKKLLNYLIIRIKRRKSVVRPYIKNKIKNTIIPYMRNTLDKATIIRSRKMLKREHIRSAKTKSFFYKSRTSLK